MCCLVWCLFRCVLCSLVSMGPYICVFVLVSSFYVFVLACVLCFFVSCVFVLCIPLFHVSLCPCPCLCPFLRFSPCLAIFECCSLQCCSYVVICHHYLFFYSHSSHLMGAGGSAPRDIPITKIEAQGILGTRFCPEVLPFLVDLSSV